MEVERELARIYARAEFRAVSGPRRYVRIAVSNPYRRWTYTMMLFKVGCEKRARIHVLNEWWDKLHGWSSLEDEHVSVFGGLRRAIRGFFYSVARQCALEGDEGEETSITVEYHEALRRYIHAIFPLQTAERLIVVRGSLREVVSALAPVAVLVEELEPELAARFTHAGNVVTARPEELVDLRPSVCDSIVVFEKGKAYHVEPQSPVRRIVRV
ncbi:hypothetical protein [Thermofilum pendens]|uniref:Uncharacterized protein n=1 Tax=Thermofilum pendens (strain DSM 2475 / Hrk 5) TaxID=368408 RepID=A1S033_THEPD|nr:hypothetical protein [Thermofilum pendens]ABL78813.1 hypothetical protein Tpen_1416 [Thermofilum pendens Hrk 5]